MKDKKDTDKYCVTHKFRLYPSNAQEEILLEHIGLCKDMYNNLLGIYNEWKGMISQYDLQSILTNVKICDHRFKKVYSKTLQYENNRLFGNLAGLKEKQKRNYKTGKLRFKTLNTTMHYNQSGFELIGTKKRYNKLKLSKIGLISIRAHNKLKGNIKQVVIKKYATGKWYANIIEERDDKKKIIDICDINKSVGIDLGVKDIIYDSNNYHITNPKHLKQHQEKIKKIQRKLSKKQRGSNNRNKVRIKLTNVYDKVANIRKDFMHKISHYYVKNYDLIFLEDMDVAGLVEKNKLAKYILDVGFGMIRTYILYKANRAGKICILVETKGTTYTCHKCGNKVHKSLNDRTHKCSKCGIKIPRDYNSALEIERRGLLAVGAGRTDLKPVENEQLNHLEQVRSMKQEAMSLTA